MPLEQPPGPLHGVTDVEQPPDQRLDPRERPALVLPPMSQRAALQLPLQTGYLLVAEPGPPRRSLRQHSYGSALAPGTAPSLHRPLAHPQLGGDPAGRLARLEPGRGLKPDPFPSSPTRVSQPTTLRIPHAQGPTQHRTGLSGECPRHHSIKFSSSRWPGPIYSSARSGRTGDSTFGGRASPPSARATAARLREGHGRGDDQLTRGAISCRCCRSRAGGTLITLRVHAGQSMDFASNPLPVTPRCRSIECKDHQIDAALPQVRITA